MKTNNTLIHIGSMKQKYFKMMCSHGVFLKGYFKLILFLLSILSINSVLAFETTEITTSQLNTSYFNSSNYIFSKTIMWYTKPLTGTGIITPDKDFIQSLQYFDGLGRPLQTINYQASPAGKDIIQPFEYNAMGLEEKKYLPYTLTTSTALGKYRQYWKDEQKSFLQNIYSIAASEPYGYALTLLEKSPLNRVIKQGAPGSEWQPDITTTLRASNEHVTSFSFSGSSSDVVYYWTISGDISSTNGITFTRLQYGTNALYKTIVTDENKKNTTEYKDKKGKVVLKVDHNGEKTYYIYDDFELLRCVFPPLATSLLSLSTFTIKFPATTPNSIDFNELCYYYEYDQKQRMVIKKLPGTTAIYEMTYDNLDRLRLVKDPNGNPIETSYDIFSRPVQTKNTFTGKWLTKTYYDAYPKSGSTSYDLLTTPNDFRFTSVYTENIKNTALKGLITVTLSRTLDPISGTVIRDSLITINYYDKYGRIIQTVSQNHKEGIDRISFKYKYKNSDIVAEKTHDHSVKINGTLQNKKIVEKFNYDHAGRLVSTRHKIDPTAEVKLDSIIYDEAGQIASNNLNAVQAVNYKYNIRGWLYKINDPDVTSSKLFNLKLEYTYYDNSNNIHYMTWKNDDAAVKKYEFGYDNLNRLKTSTYFQSGFNYKYSESYNYDANGNITNVWRRGSTSDGAVLPGKIDSMFYVYNNGNKSNRLWAVGDYAPDVAGRGDFTEASDGLAVQEYLYDKNGNMKSDANKQLTSIQYNILNLPKSISKYSAYTMYNSYTTTGMKIATKITGSITDTTEYIGPFVYNGNVLDYISTSAGRAVFASGAFSYYEYHIKDHLGNVRVAFKNNGGTALAIQKNNYYPFGMLMQERTDVATNKNEYLYNGKEFVRDGNLDWLDYGARMYDPQLGRWHVIDAMAESHFDYTPYNYCFNNPLIFIDPVGLDTTWVLDQAEQPEGDAEYTATLYVEQNGELNGPYEGSSFPDDDDANTLNEGEYDYNNEYGHSGGSRKGLNIVDENGNRNAPGTDTDGNEVNMTNVNVHDSFNDNSRNSEGCPTVPHNDPDGLFDNFDWGGTYNGHTGTTGNSTGTLILMRGAAAETMKSRLEYRQNPLQPLEPIRATQVTP